MSTAYEVMTRQLEQQAKEINELRRRAGPSLPKLEQIKPRQEVSHEELKLLKEAQVAGKYNDFAGQREVVCMDAANRPVTFAFGNPNSVWDQFNLGVRYARRFITGR